MLDAEDPESGESFEPFSEWTNVLWRATEPDGLLAKAAMLVDVVTDADHQHYRETIERLASLDADLPRRYQRLPAGC